MPRRRYFSIAKTVVSMLLSGGGGTWGRGSARTPAGLSPTQATSAAGERLERAAEGVRETALPTEIDGERGGVGPVGLEAARQRLEDGARAAADVEDARAGRELDPPVDHVLDDPQARDAPPVGLLDLIDRPTEDLVH